MKNYYFPKRRYFQVVLPATITKAMRITAFLLFVCAMNVHARTYSQDRLTLNLKNVKLSQVFSIIQQKTEYQFLYNTEDVLKAPTVSISVKRATVPEILADCFESSPLGYRIENKTVVVVKKIPAKPISLPQMGGFNTFEDSGILTNYLSGQLSVPDSIHRVEFVVKGKVTDENGNPLAGVSVTLKGSRTVGTTTNENGEYSLSLENRNGRVLIFSAIGHSSREIPINGRTLIDIVLQTSTSSLEQVVIVGYGTVKKKDLTGAVSSIKGSDMNAFPVTNPVQALSGRATGVSVVQNNGAPGASVSVRIRGTNSISGNNEPLYVIDGFPVTGNPNILNNGDIESVEVLKDASATAIYGSRGANGVVIITTKSGRAGKTKINYESSFGIQSIRKKIEMMNAKEFANFYNEVGVNQGETTPRFSQSDIASFQNSFDWQDFVYHKALMQNHNISVGGGNESTRFSTSLSYFGQDGIIKNSGYDRFSIRNNLDHKVSNKINLKSSLILTRVNGKNQNSSGGGRGTSLISGSLYSFPTVTPYLNDGTIRDLRTIYPWTPEIINPAYFIDESKSKNKSNEILANLAVLYEPIDGLIIKVSGGVESADNRSNYFNTSKFSTFINSASITRTNYTSLLNENTVSYSKTVGKHSFSGLTGFTAQNFRNTSIGASGQGFLSDILDVYNLQSALSPGIPTSSYSYSALLSFLGRINYNFNDRILATFNFRADGSSRYTAGDKWGYFPSGAIAWRISKENFLRPVTFISDMKIRVGWGETGSQAIAPYSTLNALSSGNVVFGDNFYVDFVPGKTLPGILRWETTNQFDAGLEMEIFENRIGITVDYYKKRTDDLLNPVPLSSSTGYSNTIRNVGSIQNNGIELSISGNIFTQKDFRWRMDLNTSFNKNKILKLYGGDDIFGAAYNVTILNEPINILREGQPLGVFFGYLQDGYDDKGLLKYKDLNKDGSINASDRTIIGNPNPKFIFGFNNSILYKNFGLTLFFQGISGRDIFNLGKVNTTLDVGFGGNMPSEVFYDHWSPSNPNAKYPLPTTANSVRVSDRFVENGSYIRLRDVELSYNILSNPNNGISSLQIYIGGQNLLTITKYSWWDPEVNSLGGASSITQGIDYHTYPNYKSVNFGIRLKM